VVLVGVADVDVRVKKGSVIDAHAQFETTFGIRRRTVFPCFPPISLKASTSE